MKSNNMEQMGLPRAQQHVSKEIEEGVREYEVNRDTKNNIFQKKYEMLDSEAINQGQLETAKFIANNFGHLWAKDEVYSNLINEIKSLGRSEITIKDIQEMADRHDTSTSKSYHTSPIIELTQDDNIVLRDESASRRFQWYAYEDGSYKIDISKRDEKSKSGGIIVFSVNGDSVGEGDVSVMSTGFELRHVLSLRDSLISAGLKDDSIDKKMEKSVEMLSPNEQQEYKEKVSKMKIYTLSYSAEMKIINTSIDLLQKNNNMTSQELKLALSSVVDSFWEDIKNTKWIITRDKDEIIALSGESLSGWLQCALRNDYVSLMEMAKPRKQE